MKKIMEMEVVEFPLLGPEEGSEQEDKGSGYNFGKRWTYLPGTFKFIIIFKIKISKKLCFQIDII